MTPTPPRSPPAPDETQRRALCALLHDALCDLRALGWSGRAEQAAALVDAFHNLPVVMLSDGFRWDWFRQELETYAARYPEGGAHYLRAFDTIEHA